MMVATETNTDRPLAGRRIVLTRAAGKNTDLAARIAAAGGLPFIFPTIATVPVADDHIIREALAQLDRYSFIVFTSAEAVEHLTRLLPTLPHGGDQLRYAAVGSATAEALRIHGIHDVLVPDDFRAEGLIALFTKIAIELKQARATAPAKRPKVLIPRALIAREVLPQALEQLGFDVTVAPLYETVMPDVRLIDVRRLVVDAKLACDAVVFMSPSAAKNFVELISRAGADGVKLLAEVDCYSIGAPTTAALRKLGISGERVHQAAEATAESVFTALIG